MKGESSNEGIPSSPRQSSKHRSSPSLRDSFSNRLKNRSDGRSEAIKFDSSFVDLPLEARYVKGTATQFREMRFQAVVVATVSALVANLLMAHAPSSGASGQGILSWSIWANAPLNLSLSLFVVGLYSLEPRKSTQRMLHLQRIATGLLLVVSICVVYTAAATLRGTAGAGSVRVQRTLELNVGGLLFMLVIVVGCETIAVVHTAIVVGAWSLGWLLTLYGVSSWGYRAAGWCVLEGLAVLCLKWTLEYSRRCRWLTMLRMEGELRTLGEFSLAGMRGIDDSSDGGSLRGTKHKAKLSDPQSDPELTGSDRENNNNSPYLSTWIFGKNPNGTEGV